MEVWKPVVGYEGLYEVSDMGRVRSMARVVPHPTGGRLTIRERLLSVNKAATMKYPMVNLWREGRPSSKYIHALILEAFVGPRPARHDACHNDGCVDNTVLSNLRWDTRAANVADAKRHGTFSNPPSRWKREAV